MTALLRPDQKAIAELVKPGARVLDIGCGTGELLAYLSREKQVDGRGIEISQEAVSRAIASGLPVIQGDADADLMHYPDKAFDYAILSKALQAMHKPKDVLEHMVRIAGHVIVSIPNFGYWRNRLQLLVRGRMPVTKTLSYEWYDTPNIHFCTIRDFIILCEELGFVIEHRISVTNDGHIAPFHHHSAWVNWSSEQAVFMIRAK